MKHVSMQHVQLPVAATVLGSNILTTEQYNISAGK
jgi:hypothetical protein